MWIFSQRRDDMSAKEVFQYGAKVVLTDGVNTMSSDVVYIINTVFAVGLAGLWSQWLYNDMVPRLGHAILISSGVATDDADAMFPPASHNDWAVRMGINTLVTVMMIIVHWGFIVVGHAIAAGYAKCTGRCSNKLVHAQIAPHPHEAKGPGAQISDLGVRKRQFGATGVTIV